MNSLTVTAITTGIFHKGQSLSEFIVNSVPNDLVREKMVLVVTSKLISIAENRFVDRKHTDKITLIKKEADVFLGQSQWGSYITVKAGMLNASAGIDESNSEDGEYILYPEYPYQSAEKIWRHLKDQWQLKDFGLILTDSHSSALRQGITGTTLAFWGFRAMKSLIGKPDLFGRKLIMTKSNFADPMAAAAVMQMGEGDESRPLAMIFGADLEFCDSGDPDELQIPVAEDLYFPLLKDLVKK